MQTKSNGEVLEGARDVLRDPAKWIQNGLRHMEPDRHCIVGAIQVVDDCNEWTPFRSAYNHPVVRLLNERVGSVAHWNDQREHHAEVLELLNLAIADELAKEQAEASEPIAA